MKLDWKVFETQVAMQANMLESNLEFRTIMESTTDCLLVRLSAHVLSDQHPPSEHVSYYKAPATWWDHLKATYRMPPWFKPPRFETRKIVVELRPFTTYPHARYERQFGKGYLHFNVREIERGL